jgi:hypothetical protein
MTDELLQKNFAACLKQAKHLEVSLERIKSIAPFDNDKLKNLTEDEVMIIDAFIMQFGKLQDMLGNKIFKTLVDLSMEKSGTMIDTLNTMDKLCILDDVDGWRKIRDARNSVIHDYDLEEKETAKRLNNIIDFVPHLFVILERVKKYVKEKFNIEI